MYRKLMYQFVNITFEIVLIGFLQFINCILESLSHQNVPIQVYSGQDV